MVYGISSMRRILLLTTRHVILPTKDHIMPCTVSGTVIFILDTIVVRKKLADQFQKKTWANKWASRRSLYSLKLKEGDSVHKHIKLMTEIFEELLIIGNSIDEEDRVVHLQASFPDSYDMLVTVLKASQDVSKRALVTERLLYEETKIRGKETGAAESKGMWGMLLDILLPKFTLAHYRKVNDVSYADKRTFKRKQNKQK